jgi:predicted CXXCH cytochrome family protein
MTWPVLAVVLLLRPPVAGAAGDSCVGCHSKLEEANLRDPVKGYAHDIHAERGLGCAACHGGDPTDADVTAMDPDKGFKGAPKHDQIAALCASCHANAGFMKRYNPRPYIFSLAEFQTSVHYKRGAAGDTRVATCTNCHGVHGIRPHNDPGSPIYPTNVPRTCAHCHNADYMKGRRMRTDQFALYSKSAHGVALLEKGDVSAPACNDCHGNHGAAPPGLADVTAVCGTCHGRAAELFEKSRMKAGMEAQGKRGCVTCHSNHAVLHPTDAMFSTGREGTCSGCHPPGSKAETSTALLVSGFDVLKQRLARSDSLLRIAEVKGMETGQGRDALREAQDRLVGLRATLHSFEPGIIGAVLEEGTALASKAGDHGAAALRDWRVRRVGMAWSVVIILMVIGLVVARIRHLED